MKIRVAFTETVVYDLIVSLKIESSKLPYFAEALDTIVLYEGTTSEDYPLPKVINLADLDYQISLDKK